MSVINIPNLNPYRFHKIGSGDFAQNLIPSFESAARYAQKVQPGDLFYMQLQISGGSLWGGVYQPACKLIDNNGNTVHTFQVEQSSGAAVYTGWINYYFCENFPSVTDGVYYLKLDCYAPKDPNGFDYGQFNFLSEPLYIKTSHENTCLINYRLTYNDFDCIFTDEVARMTLRVEGGVRSEGFQPGGKYQMFSDMDYEPVMLQATPYNVYKFTFGPGNGVPNWLADRLNRIFSCDDITIDGIAYLRNEGAKLEANREGGYPHAGWSIELLKVDAEHSEGFDLDYLTADSTLYTADSTTVTTDKTLI